MKKNYKLLKISIFSTLLSVMTAGYAACVENSGHANYGNTKIACLKVSGKATLNQTTVTGSTDISGELVAIKAHLDTVSVDGKTELRDTTVTDTSKISGNLIAINSHLDKIVVNGKTELRQTTVNGSTEVTGPLFASSSHLNNDITVKSDTVKLTKTTVNNITIDSDSAQQTLHLNSSVVNGNVKFTSGNGIVYISGKSKISGKLIGGKIAS